MKTTCDYLDAVAVRLGGASDYRVAMTLGISPQAICNWRKGRDSIGDDAAIKVAEILGIDPAEILLSSYAAKSKNAMARVALENAIRKLGGAAAALALSVLALFSSSDVSAATMPTAQNQVGDSLYYVKSQWQAVKAALCRFFCTAARYAIWHKNGGFSGNMRPA